MSQAETYKQAWHRSLRSFVHLNLPFQACLIMPLELLPSTKDDAPEAARLLVASYQNNPFRKIIFPNGMSQASIDKIQQMRYDAVDDPDQHPWKVVDADSGEMAACATWIYTKAMSDEDWDLARERGL
jgi:hypothetical protein